MCVESILQQYNLSQMIQDPTHFTESSESLIDLYMVSSPDTVLECGVGEPFLDQAVRYHCPIYCVLRFHVSRGPVFKRRVWKYSEVDYNKLRDLVSSFNWNSCVDDNIDSYTSALTTQLMSFCELCIPTKVVTIRTNEPQWFHNDIRKALRRRRRAYRRAKRTGLVSHWIAYNQLRNRANSLVRSAKQNHFDKLSLKLRECSVNSADFWKLLKNFVNPSTLHRDLPPLIHGDRVYETASDKQISLIPFFNHNLLCMCLITIRSAT